MSSLVMRRTVAFACMACLGLSLLVACVQAFEFELVGGTTRCFSEELTPKSAMIGEARLFPAPSQQIDVEVLSPTGLAAFSERNVDKTVHFRVQADDVGGDYKICFHNRLPAGTLFSSGLQRRIEFDLRSGVNAVDYEKVATKEHLKPIEVHLRHMEDVVRELNMELMYQKDREAEMRDTNESTNVRVSLLCMLCLAIVLGMGVWQSMYIKSFLSKKKII